MTTPPRRGRARRAPSAKPMRPEERLPTKRTPSIGSRVPPAVTSTLRPRASAPAPTALERSPASTVSHAASNSAGSGRRPTPSRRASPGVRAGLDDLHARARAGARGWRASPGAPTCGCSSPGPRSAGSVAAERAAVSRLSARPCASFAIVFADAGAIRKTSAARPAPGGPRGHASGSGSPGEGAAQRDRARTR